MLLEGGTEGRREGGWRDGGREGWRDGGKGGWREGGREGGREEGRGGGGGGEERSEADSHDSVLICSLVSRIQQLRASSPLVSVL